MEWRPDDVPSARAGWLVREIGTFLAEEADDATRDATARVALRNGHRDFAAFPRRVASPRTWWACSSWSNVTGW